MIAHNRLRYQGTYRLKFIGFISSQGCGFTFVLLLSTIQPSKVKWRSKFCVNFSLSVSPQRQPVMIMIKEAPTAVLVTDLQTRTTITCSFGTFYNCQRSGYYLSRLCPEKYLCMTICDGKYQIGVSER